MVRQGGTGHAASFVYVDHPAIRNRSDAPPQHDTGVKVTQPRDLCVELRGAENLVWALHTTVAGRFAGANGMIRFRFPNPGAASWSGGATTSMHCCSADLSLLPSIVRSMGGPLQCTSAKRIRVPSLDGSVQRSGSAATCRVGRRPCGRSSMASSADGFTGKELRSLSDSDSSLQGVGPGAHRYSQRTRASP